MKSLTNLMLATALVMVASTAASAQVMKAQVPFAFQVSGKTLPAGTYDVSRVVGEKGFLFRNVENHQAATVIAGANEDPQDTWKSLAGGVLQFECSDRCSLSRIWTHRGYPAHDVHVTRTPQEQPVRIAEVRMTATSGD